MAYVVATELELLERYAKGERDFAGAQLGEGNLDGANLSGVHLRRADLYGARLRGAQLTEARLDDANLGSSRLNRIGLRQASLKNASLNSADLTDGDFAEADLRNADLGQAVLDNGNFSGANLTLANLSDGSMRGADFRGANLSLVNASGSDLEDANLTCADLRSANLSGARMKNASLEGAILDQTILTDVDISPFCCVDLTHRGPSVLDYRTIIRSAHKVGLDQFLRDIGMPEVFVQYSIDSARSLNPLMLFSLLQSTFISYGAPDENFARRLNRSLRKEGVTTFFFKDDAVPGDELQAMMRRGVNEHDRVILVCSRASLDRKGLLNEVKETLRREAREGGRSYLIPVVLDDYLFTGWKPLDPDLDPRAVTDRVAADFRDTGEFRAGILKLVKALKKP